MQILSVISVQNSTTKIEHEASTSKIGEEQIFYFYSEAFV
jgi:Fe-S cluster assembly protein SufB